MKTIGIILISLFLFSCEEEDDFPVEFVDTVNYRIFNIVNDDIYIVNDPETGIESITLLSYQFVCDSNQLFYRNPVPNKPAPANFFTSEVLHDSEFPSWNRIEMNEMILYSEDYNKIEFSLDYLDSDFIRRYKDSTRYNDFKTIDKLTLIVKGSYIKNGKYNSFSLKSFSKGKIGAIFEPDSRLYYNVMRKVEIEMSAESFFTVDGKVIEPIQSNMSKLEENFSKCLVARAF